MIYTNYDVYHVSEWLDCGVTVWLVLKLWCLPCFRVVGLWRDSITSSNAKAAQSLADPTEYENLFPGLRDAFKAQQYLIPQQSRPIPARVFEQVPVSSHVKLSSYSDLLWSRVNMGHQVMGSSSPGVTHWNIGHQVMGSSSPGVTHWNMGHQVMGSSSPGVTHYSTGHQVMGSSSPGVTHWNMGRVQGYHTRGIFSNHFRGQISPWSGGPWPA